MGGWMAGRAARLASAVHLVGARGANPWPHSSRQGNWPAGQSNRWTVQRWAQGDPPAAVAPERRLLLQVGSPLQGITPPVACPLVQRHSRTASKQLDLTEMEQVVHVLPLPLAHPASPSSHQSLSTAAQLPSARVKNLHCSKFKVSGPLPTHLVIPQAILAAARPPLLRHLRADSTRSGRKRKEDEEDSIEPTPHRSPPQPSTLRRPLPTIHRRQRLATAHSRPSSTLRRPHSPPRTTPEPHLDPISTSSTSSTRPTAASSVQRFFRCPLASLLQ